MFWPNARIARRTFQLIRRLREKDDFARKVLVTASVASFAALALSTSPAATADTTLVLFEHDTMQHQTDLGAPGPGPGPGDQFLFAGDVFDRPGGMFLGTASGSCTELNSNNGAEQMVCNATLNLVGGQIVVQSVGDMGEGDTHQLSVIGGTGIRQNARGTGTVQIPHDVPNETDANFVLNLTG